MNCQGFYEAEVIDDATGETVQYHKSKNTVLYGFIGGLFSQLFGVESDKTSLGTNDPSRYSDVEQVRFGRLYLFKYTGSSQNTTSASDNNDPATYIYEATENKGWKNLETSGNISQYSVTFDPATSKVTLTLQVTFATTEGLYGTDNPTVWAGIGIGSSDITSRGATVTSRLITRVTMSSPIQKSNSQTLRVRYNFSIVVA